MNKLSVRLCLGAAVALLSIAVMACGSASKPSALTGLNQDKRSAEESFVPSGLPGAMPAPMPVVGAPARGGPAVVREVIREVPRRESRGYMSEMREERVPGRMSQHQMLPERFG